MKRDKGLQSVKAYMLFLLPISLLALVITIPLLMDPIASPALALFCGIAASEFRERVTRYLHERIETKDGPMWDVEVDDVPVGRLDDDEYASILLCVWADPRNYIAQALNGFKYVASICIWTLAYLPLILFWSALVFAAIEPAGSITTWRALSASIAQTPDALITQVVQLAPIVPFLLLITITISIPFAHLLGWRNMFRARADAIVRVRFNTTGNGRAVLRRMDGGEPVIAGIL